MINKFNNFVDYFINTRITFLKVKQKILYKSILKLEALESGMCDVMKIRLKRRDATRSGKENQTLNVKTAV